jgi:alpha-N-acetylglucosamine transferase
MAFFSLRRVRIVLIVGTLLVVTFSMSHFVRLPAALLVIPHNTTQLSPKTDSVNWSGFAYVQYVTNQNHLCNSLMMFEALHRFGAKADRIMMFPEDWHVPLPEEESIDISIESKLLAQARDLYQAKLVPIKIQSVDKGDLTWQESYIKLLAFNQTQYKRLISLDSDGTLQDVSILPPPDALIL